MNSFVARKTLWFRISWMSLSKKPTNLRMNAFIMRKKTCPNSKENQLIYEYVYNLLFLEYVALNKKY